MIERLNLNPDAIRRANNASHFNPGDSYAREAQGVYDSLLPLFCAKPDHTDEQREYLSRRATDWKALVEKAYSDIIARRAQYVPVTVAGPSNYPAEKMRKKADACMRAGTEWTEKFKRFEENTKKALDALTPVSAQIEKYRRGYDAPVSSDDPAAVEKVAARLEYLKADHARMKSINAWYRGHGTCAGHPELSLASALKIDEAVEAAHSWEKQPYPAYMLTNSNGNIRRLESRLRELHAARIVRQEPEAECERFAGLSIRRNAGINRVQILFDEKPDEETRALLKEYGFRWSPRECAWQRQLNGNGLHAARRIAKELTLDGS